ncbi:cytochrome P450, family 51 (sterol 14-demethylase) [Cladophialophora psammophila CBS 110553]|uniref:sterol 14alpha-demethylase n=1 Tax=Cladophialophora psammophila CBS 110553 TaxID=1182543 RepID=W9W595_9EURO|nr:cytochrome P450, family 51 (sterol 14-demethylase) [Cladophialophora psammophila CBS 110553]EXJ53739.1 cytochrome P450, family 51 (sterol 14-demethylase) [Cladophialophora psammophila CBS 110553]
MGLLATLSKPAERLLVSLPIWQLALLGFAAFLVLCVAWNVVRQVLLKDKNAPPEVWSWFPVLGNTIWYGMDPFDFFFTCKEKYGDVFTFILLGRRVTVCLGTKGNEFILNGKLKDVNAEEIYTGLTTPVFGEGVVYDCPNSKLMEQKKFVKFGLTMEAFQSYVDLISSETRSFVEKGKVFQAHSGKIDIVPTMAELTIYTASRSLQGPEVRAKFDSTFADLYHDLDMGFSPINFMLSWAPLPHNRKRDIAQKKMTDTYMEIIKQRRDAGGKREKGDEDMIWNLMGCTYKDGTPVPDREVAHMMIALLMAGQHSSSSTSSWILLRLATRPDIQEDLLEEQKRVLGEDLPPLTYENLQKLTLNAQVVKETLRLHAPIHSILRKVKSPMTIVANTPTTTKTYQIPTTHTLLSAPGVTSRESEFFPDPMTWEPHRWDEGHPLAYTRMGMDKEEFEDYGYGMISKGASSPYLPFGAGRHRCIGEQFAYVQLGAVLATIVRLVKLRQIEGKELVPTDYSSLFSRPMAPAVVEFEKREKA